LTNIYRPPREGNFCDEQWKAQKPVTVTDNNQNMGYVEKGAELLKTNKSENKEVDKKIIFPPL
jgi:hypothetical protein